MPPSDDEISIVHAVQRGDCAAYRVLVERHGPILYSLLRRLVRDPQLAEELAQETFVRAYERISTFSGRARFRTWLVQIGINLVRDRRRTAGRAPKVVSLDELRERGAPASEPADERFMDEPLDALSRKETLARLEREIEGLPADYREAFVLKHVENLSYNEMAEITGNSVGSLKVRVHRARVWLRRALLSEPDGEVSHGRTARSLP